jgi:Protein of unknown function (DUF3164)
MSDKQPVPKGYWENADGSLVPDALVKPLDKDRHRVVVHLCEAAKRVSAVLQAYKLQSMQEVQDFVDRSLAEYDVRYGRVKGNVTLVSFDGRYKIVRQMQENIVFDERLQAAKALIDECIHRWAKGSNANIKALVNNAFQVDKQGSVSTGRVLGLRKLEIADEQWAQAMRAIGDSMRVSSTKPYIRFYERNEAGEYLPISLDVAAV